MSSSVDKALFIKEKLAKNNVAIMNLLTKPRLTGFDSKYLCLYLKELIEEKDPSITLIKKADFLAILWKGRTTKKYQCTSCLAVFHQHRRHTCGNPTSEQVPHRATSGQTSSKNELIHMINKNNVHIKLSKPFMVQQSDSTPHLIGVCQLIYSYGAVQKWIRCSFCNDLDIQNQHPCFQMENALKKLNELISINSKFVELKPSSSKNKYLLEVYFHNFNINCSICSKCQILFVGVDHDCEKKNDLINVNSKFLITTTKKFIDKSSTYSIKLLPPSTIQRPLPELLKRQQQQNQPPPPPPDKSSTFSRKLPEIQQQRQQIQPSPPDMSKLIEFIGCCQLNYAIESMLPPQQLHSTEFLQILQKFVDIGAKYGPIIINKQQLLPNEEELMELRKKKIISMKSQLKLIVKNHKLTYSCDIWKDLNKNKIYLILSGYYMNKQFQINSIVLGIRPLINISLLDDGDKSTTLVKINNDNDANEIIFNIFDILKEFSIITDNDLLINDAKLFLKGSLITMNASFPKNYVETMLNDHNIILTECIGSYVNDFLNEIYKFNKFDQFKKSSTAIQQQQKNDLDISHLQVLQSFNKVLTSLCNSSFYSDDLVTQPNINQIYLFNNTFLNSKITKLKLTKPYPNDLENSKVNKLNEMFDNLKLKFTDKFYRLAIFLDLRYRSLKMLTADQREETINYVKRLITIQNELEIKNDVARNQELKKLENKKILKIQYIDAYGNIINEQIKEEEEDPLKIPDGRDEDDDDVNMQEIDNYLVDYMDESILQSSKKSPNKLSLEVEIDNEIKSYVNYIPEPQTVTNLTEFWRTADQFLPRLKKLTEMVLCCPAVSATSVVARFNETIKLNVVNRFNILNYDDLEAYILLNGNKHLNC